MKQVPGCSLSTFEDVPAEAAAESLNPRRQAHQCSLKEMTVICIFTAFKKIAVLASSLLLIKGPIIEQAGLKNCQQFVLLLCMSEQLYFWRRAVSSMWLFAKPQQYIFFKSRNELG
jgi:hypothetical protein